MKIQRGKRAARLRELVPKGFWRRFKKNRPALVGLGILIFMVGLALLGEYIAPFDPRAPIAEAFLPPAPPYYMGTDEVGRDIFSRILVGARVSLMIGVAASFSIMSIGVLVGAVSGFYGGMIDEIIMRFTEIWMVIPGFFIILLFVALFGASMQNVILVIALTTWPGAARLIRANFLSLKERAYVEAATAVGTSKRDIIFSEILPNTFNIAIVSGALRVGGVILMYTGLSFLGLGDPLLVNWGTMLKDAIQYLRIAWWAGVFPGLAVTLTVLAFNLVSDGLNDALNPRGR